ncbi:MAG: esterase [Porticoccaceae bacterium]|nr:MAG: esterase [Porticoccaceae bacterium]
MATFVLVHGGGHGGWCWRFVAERLRARGHEVYTPTLTGLGERSHLLSPAVDLALHIQDVVNVLRFEDLAEVVLVGHSYGGMVITGVADRVPERIAHLVYLDAARPSNGQSLVAVAPEMMALARESLQVVDGVELVLFPGKFPMLPGDYYGVTDPQLIEWMAPKLTPHPWKSFAQKLELEDEARVRQIPETIVITPIRNLSPADKQALVALTQGRFFEVDTGHDLMISAPDQTADILHQVAGG